MNLAFSRLEEGYENALKDYYKKQVHNILELVDFVAQNLCIYIIMPTSTEAVCFSLCDPKGS